jgi:hypothetical protein
MHRNSKSKEKLSLLTIHLLNGMAVALSKREEKTKEGERACILFLFFTCRHPMEVLCPRRFIANIRSFPISTVREKG